MSEAITIPVKYIFLDIVGFTHNRSVEAQSDIIKALNRIVETTIKEHGINKDDVMFLPAGDGICIALLNVGTPYDIHLQIALSIVGKVYKHSVNTPNKMRKFEVRVGINSYTDNLVTDINGNQNIAGAGVNLASRIMKMADGNQILVSKLVYDDFRHYEKYASSFKSYHAKIKEDVELPVYQFIASGYEGLNVTPPISLRDAVSSPKAPVAASPKPQIVEQPRPVEPARKTPVGVEKPIFVTQSSAIKAPQVNTQTEHTLSYLKGILPEPEKTETKSESAAAKTEVLPFLEHSEPKRNRSFVWTFAIILLLGSAALGAWYLMSKQTAPSSSQSLANTNAASPAVAPVNNPTTTQNQAQNPAVTQTNQPSKSVTASTPSPASETKASNDTAAFKPQPAARRKQTAPRQVVQQTAVQRPSPAPAKQQTVRASKPKPSRRVTLEDLIN